MGSRTDSNYASGTTFTDRDGTFHPAAITTNVISTAVNRTMTVDESGSTILVTAADKVISLPATEAGLTYTIVTIALSSGTGTSVDPVTADKIQGLGLTGANNKDVINTGSTDEVGDSLTVLGDGGDGYIITNSTGAWAAEG